MFLIIGVFGSRQRKKRAALLFFLYSLFGSFFLLFGILIILFETGSSDFSVILNFNFSLLKQKILWICFFISFGSKFPLYPFHIWLPEAHVEAPTSGSIILAAILLKIGAYGVFRFMLPILPLANLFFNSLIYLISLLTIFIASCVAFRQVDTKKIIAYSSIAHMGLGFLGLFSGNIYGLSGAVFLMICHGFVSSGLFFTAGLLYERFYTRQIFEYGGLVTTMPVFTFFFFFLFKL
jgi:NADH:ubiquinone oxidoreductase subunit 4 (subunit M)